MSHFTHNQDFYAFSLTNSHLICLPGVLHKQEVQNSPDNTCAKNFHAATPTNKPLRTVVAPALFSGGLWLELLNHGSKQLFQANICRAGSNEKLAQKSFVLSQGKNSFFRSLDNFPWHKDTYVLIIRGEKHLLQCKFT